MRTTPLLLMPCNLQSIYILCVAQERKLGFFIFYFFPPPFSLYHLPKCFQTKVVFWKTDLCGQAQFYPTMGSPSEKHLVCSSSVSWLISYFSYQSAGIVISSLVQYWEFVKEANQENWGKNTFFCCTQFILLLKFLFFLIQ